jgi:hypothetical protein
MATRKPKSEGLAAIVAKQDPVSIQDLTMQDFFAAFAMQGMLADPTTPEIMDIAGAAYEVADAMLKARQI